MGHIMSVRALIALLFLTTAANAGEIYCSDNFPWCMELGEYPAIHRNNQRTDCTEKNSTVMCENGFVGIIEIQGETLTITSEQWTRPAVLNLIQ